MKTVEYHVFKGAKALTATVAATAVSDQSDTVRGAVRLTFGSAHGFLAGSDSSPREIYLSGFSGDLSYLNGMHRVLDIPSSTTMDVSIRVGEFTAGTPAGTEKASVAVALGHNRQFAVESYSLYLGSSPSTAEDLRLIVDPEASGVDSAGTATLDTVAMSGESSFAKRANSDAYPIPEGGVVWLDWDNTDGVSWEARIGICRL